MERGLVLIGVLVFFEILFMFFCLFLGFFECLIYLVKLEIKWVVKEEMIRLVSKMNYVCRFLEFLIFFFCLIFFWGKKNLVREYLFFGIVFLLFV